MEKTIIVKVFSIDTAVSEIQIGGKEKTNILILFSTLSKESHLITNCFLDKDNSSYIKSPIYYFYEAIDKENFDYVKIANDLLRAECKADNTRNSTIREGLLFIKASNKGITIMKLEKLTVIDMDTYEIKSELGKEKDYFKVCTFKGDYDDIEIIDKNRTAAKYWYQKFLGLTRKRTSEDNTNDVIQQLGDDKFFQQEIVNIENYNEIKRFTEYYLFDNKKFDKSDLFDELNSSGLVALNKEEELFSDYAKNVDSDFNISETVVNKKYKRTIQATRDIIIITKNYLTSVRDSEIEFDEQNKMIIIIVDEDNIKDVKENLGFV